VSAINGLKQDTHTVLSIDLCQYLKRRKMLEDNILLLKKAEDERIAVADTEANVGL